MWTLNRKFEPHAEHSDSSTSFLGSVDPVYLIVVTTWNMKLSSNYFSGSTIPYSVSKDILVDESTPTYTDFPGELPPISIKRVKVAVFRVVSPMSEPSPVY